jgi:hypothetical protein
MCFPLAGLRSYCKGARAKHITAPFPPAPKGAEVKHHPSTRWALWVVIVIVGSHAGSPTPSKCRQTRERNALYFSCLIPTLSPLLCQEKVIYSPRTDFLIDCSHNAHILVDDLVDVEFDAAKKH